MASEGTLRILCIHGYRQSGQAFRERTGAFRKIIKKKAELIFIDAPNVIPQLPTGSAEVSSQPEAAEQLGWWFSRADDYFHAQEDSDCDKGFPESMKLVENLFQEQGPFDGVLGFSQGASFVSMMCGRLQREKEACPLQFQFAILVAGFKSRSQQHEVYYQEPITIPTLHVFGDTDKVIQKEMSEDLVKHFESPILLSHPGGHFIPASGPQKKTYLEFLGKMASEKS